MGDAREHDWLSKIVNSANSALIVIDRDRKIIFANDTAARVADVPRSEQLLGKNYDDILRQSQVFEENGLLADPEDFPSVHVLKTGQAIRGKVYERVYKGMHAWLSIDATPLLNQRGEPEYCIIRFSDISEDKWRRDRLEFLVRSEKNVSLTTDYHARLIEKARLTVPALADWCTLNLVQRDGTIQRVAVVHRDPQKEALVRRLAELSEMELGDGGIRSVIATGQPYFVPEVSSQLLAVQPHVSNERRALIAELQVCSSMTLPILSGGSVLGALTVAYAESRRHYTEKDLEFMGDFCYHLGVAVDNAKLYEDIRARDKAKEDFLAALSHELRNPLAPIQSSLELLMLSADLEKNEELSVVKRQFDHLTNILNDLLDVTRYMRGKIQVEKEQVDLSRLLRSVVQSYQPLATKRRISLEIAVPENPVLIWGDPVRLRQAVMNLIDNAQKFTSEDGTIKISLAQDQATAFLTVADTGIGIAGSDLEHIFDMHFQGASKLRTHRSGLGLGLVLVKNIVDLHDGRIEATSGGLGAGTEFNITLPLLQEA